MLLAETKGRPEPVDDEGESAENGNHHGEHRRKIRNFSLEIACTSLILCFVLYFIFSGLTV